MCSSTGCRAAADGSLDRAAMCTPLVRLSTVGCRVFQLPPSGGSHGAVRLTLVELAEWLPLDELLHRQDQLIRRDQAFASGLPRTLIDAHLRQGRWNRVLPSVYLADPAAPALEPRIEHRRLIRATWMWAGEDAVVFGAAAAFWSGQLDDRTGPIGVIVPPSRRMSAQPGVSVRRTAVGPGDTCVQQGIVLTQPHRTAVDLAANGRNELLNRMAQGKRLRPAALHRVLDQGSGRRGWAKARIAVRESLTNPHSEAERLTHRALSAGRVTGWRANAELVVLGRTIRPDLVFDDVKLIVEIDGFAYHVDRDTFETDRSRQNLLVAAGWTVLRFTWRQVLNDPASVVAQIEATRSMLRTKLASSEPRAAPSAW